MCYRPPNGNFLGRVEQLLAKIEPGKEVYILGNVNINCSQASPLTTCYLDILGFVGFHQIITEATRVTSTCSSILDHIIVNSRDLIQQCGVINYGFSDHLITFCMRGMSKDLSVESITRRIRSFKSFTLERLNFELKMVDWSSVMSSSNVDFCLSKFTRLFTANIDKVAPFRDI